MTRRPGKPRDPIWDHVTKLDNGRWQCSYCQKEYGGGATRIKAHLFRTKNQGIATCGSVPEELRNVGDGPERGDHTQADTRVPQLPTAQTNSSSSRPVDQSVAGVHPQELDNVASSCEEPPHPTVATKDDGVAQAKSRRGEPRTESIHGSFHSSDLKPYMPELDGQRGCSQLLQFTNSGHGHERTGMSFSAFYKSEVQTLGMIGVSRKELEDEVARGNMPMDGVAPMDMDGVVPTEWPIYAKPIDCNNKLNDRNTLHEADINRQTKAPECSLRDNSMREKWCQILSPMLSAYVFEKSEIEEAHKIYEPPLSSEEIVRSKSQFSILDRYEFITFKPKQHLHSSVIDYAAEHLTYKARNKKGSKHSIWSFPLSSSNYAFGEAKDFKKFVDKHKLRENFMSNFIDCKKMFIPTHISPTKKGHYYLYVVDLEQQEVAIWDSLDSLTNPYVGEQENKARDVLRSLDKLFEEEIRKVCGGGWTFVSFNVQRANHESTQTNGYDCGIFVIKFMNNFMENKADANKKLSFESEAARLDLALELLLSDINENRETLIIKATKWYQSQQRLSIIAILREANAGDQTQVNTRASQLSADINNSSSDPLNQHPAGDQMEAVGTNDEIVPLFVPHIPAPHILGDFSALNNNSPDSSYSIHFSQIHAAGASSNTQMNVNPIILTEERCANNVAVEGSSQHVDEVGNAVYQVNQQGKKRKVDVMNQSVDTRLADREGFVGQQFMHNIARMRELLMDETVSIIGIYGMGGVGKTALATHMKKEIEREGIFNHVYWITVSHEYNVHKLQRVIAKRFGLRLKKDDDQMRKMQLSKALERKKKELLILDDVWTKIDLEKVGIPLKIGGIKLILTTRLKSVCLQMNCPPNNQIHAKPLSDDEAWDLFLQKLRFDETPIKLVDEVLEIARCVANECKGLPLGIKVLGTAMKGVEDIRQWRNTLNKLQNWTLEEDVEDEVFKVLEYSYSKLYDKRMQKCFLHCALYPKDSIIEREELIMRFVDQGLINRMNRLGEIFDEGHTVLNKLVDSSLLEEITDVSKSKSVKMHDLLRDLACRITKVSPKYIIKSGKGLRTIPQPDEWTANLEVVSLMHNDIEGNLSSTSPSCPKLSTLIFSGNPLRWIHPSFFDHMPALTTLDLSMTDIKHLPDSISNLKSLVSLQLENCLHLEYVPTLGNLQALSRLVLSNTLIQVLPEGLETLTDLKWIDLSRNSRMNSQSGLFVPRLINLQYLYTGGCQIRTKAEDLEEMSCLEIFRGIVHDDGHWNAYVRNVLDRGDGPTYYHIGLVSSNFGLPRGDYQRNIIFGDIEDIKAIYMVPKDAENLTIASNNQWSCLCDAVSFSGASSVMSCSIHECNQLETVFCLSCSCSYCTNLHNLATLELFSLQRLAALWRENEDIVESLNSGLFPRLASLHIYECHNIKKLLKVGMLAHLPNLVTLTVEYCKEMKEIFSGVDEDNGLDGDEVIVAPSNNSNRDIADALTIVLPKLEELVLSSLPGLKTVCQGIMACDSFKRLRVNFCPKLRIPQIRSTFEYNKYIIV